VKEVNSTGWCGYKDWRMPTRKELESIVHFGTYNPAIDTIYFPNTQNWFWSSSPHTENNDRVWIVDFNGGINDTSSKGSYVSIRLVRSRQ